MTPFVALLLVFTAIPLLGSPSASAVDNTGQFELDGNIAHNAATTKPYDWASLFDASGQLRPGVVVDPVNGPILATAFIADYVTPDQTYFNGSNTDEDSIASATGWSCKTQSNPQAKDEITNAYAVLMKMPSDATENANDVVLFMGSERKSNSGTSFAGFWFLQNPVGCKGSGNFTGGGHTNGDLLVVNNYTSGGSNQVVEIFQWQGDDATGHLALLTSNAGGLCGSSTPDNACSIANSALLPSSTIPWPPGSTTGDAANTFVESGIDLTQLVGGVGQSPCFSTFLAETRSSAQINATLKDFAGGSKDGGQFLTCPVPTITTSTSPSGSVAPGASETDTATLSAVGGRPAPTGTVQFSLCGPTQVTSAGCPEGTGTPVGSPATISGGSATSPSVSGTTTQTSGTYCWGAAYVANAASSVFYSDGYHTDATSECFTVFAANPSLLTVKTETTGGPNPITAAGQTVPYTFTVTNNGNVTLTNVSVTDTGTAPAGNVTATCSSLSNPAGTCSGTTVASLAPNQVATFTGSYTVTQADINAGSVADSATASGTNPAGGTTTSLPSTLSIPVTQTATLTTVKSETTGGPNPITSAGQTVPYTFTVTNTGNVTLTSVSVTDTGTAPAGNVTATCSSLSNPAGTCSGSSTTLAPGQVATFTGSYTVTQADINAGSVADSATSTGTKPGGGTTTSDPSTLSIPVTQNAALTTVKAAATGSPNPITAVGQTVSYTFTVTNSGNVTLTNVSVTDTGTAPAGNLTSGPTCGTTPATTTCTNGVIASLTPGQSATLTGTYTVTQADINNGSVTDSATSTGTKPGGGTTTSQPSSVTIPVTQTGSLSTVKTQTSGPNPITSAGQTVTYSFAVTNNGNVTLTNVSVTDTGTAPAGNVTATCQSLSTPTGTCSGTTVASLAPGQTATFTGTYTVTQADINKGSVTDSATSTGTSPGGTATTSPPSSVTIPVTQNAALTTVKTQSGGPSPLTAAGQTVTYSFAVTNSGNVTLTNVSVTDTGTAPAGNVTATCQSLSSPAGTCSGATVASLAPGQTATFTGSYTVSQADINNGSVTDSATSTGTKPGGGTTTSQPSTVTIPVTQTGGLTTVKTQTGGPSPITAAGQTVTYTFVVTNTGNVTLTNVSVTDTGTAPAGNVTATCQSLSTPTGTCSGTTVASLAPGQKATFTGSYTVTQADIDAGSVADSATATGTTPGGTTTGSPPSTVTIPVTQTPGLTTVKTQSGGPNPLTAAGQTVTYTFTVTNSGNVTLTNVSVADTGTAPAGNVTATCQSLSNPAGTCSGTSVASLAPGQKATFTGTYTVTQADINNGSVTDSATSTGTKPGGGTTTSPPSSVTIQVTQNPGLTTVKTQTAGPNPITAVGQTVTYTFTVTNSGNVTITGVSVTDTGTAPAGNVTATCQSLSNPTGTCSGTTVASLAPGQTATFTGTYTVTQADMNKGSVTDSATASGTTPGGTTTGSPPSTVTIPVTQAPSLSLVKTASPTSVTTAGQTVTYSFRVTNTGNVTLNNITINDVQASPSSNSNLSAVSCPQSSLAPTASETCTATYTVTQVDLNNGSITDTATATGQTQAGTTVTSNPSSATVIAIQTILSGRAYVLGLSANLAGLALVGPETVQDTGGINTALSTSTPTPCAANAAVLDVVLTGDVCAGVTTVAAPNASSTATSSVANASIGIPTIPVINLQAVQSQSTTTCAGSSGSVTIAYLAVGGIVVIKKPTAIKPNTTLNVGVVKLVLNQQIPFSTPGGDIGLTVNAIRIQVNALGLATVDVVVASATSDIDCASPYKPVLLTGEANVAHLQASLLGTSVLGNITVNDSGPVITNATSSTTPCVASLAITDVAFNGTVCSSVKTFAGTSTVPAHSTASASVEGAVISIPTLPAITLRAVQSTSNTSCAGSSGTVTIAYLQVGSTVVISGPTQVAANTHILVGAIDLTLNQQIPFYGADQGLTVNAIAINVNAAGLAQAHLTFASSTSDIIGCT